MESTDRGKVVDASDMLYRLATKDVYRKPC